MSCVQVKLPAFTLQFSFWRYMTQCLLWMFLLGDLMQSDQGVRAASAPTIDLANLMPTQGVMFYGAKSWDVSAKFVSSAGDVNRDGLSDILIGAYEADPLGRGSAGITYLIYGGLKTASIDLLNFNETHGVKIYGAEVSDNCGLMVSYAGDVNGDNVTDILVGASSATPLGRSEAGTLYVLYGGTTLSGSIDLASLTSSQGYMVLGEANSGGIGRQIASVGDQNGDGLDDILIGAYLADPLGRNAAGTTYLLYGGSFTASTDLANLNETQGVVINGEDVSNLFGNSVASAGDVNGDGIPDLLASAILNDPQGRNNAGSTYLFYGGTLQGILDLVNFNVSQGIVIQGALGGDRIGDSVSSAGDVNQDGYDDLLIGANWASPQGRYKAGMTYLLYGNTFSGNFDLASLTRSQGIVIQGAAANDTSGFAVSSAGDVNGDGVPDILIGAYGFDPQGRIDAGAAYLLYGGIFSGNLDLANLTHQQGLVIYGASSGDNVGYAVASGGDVNGDGLTDIIVGAPHSHPLDRSLAGTTYLIYGQPLYLLNVTIVLFNDLPTVVLPSMISAHHHQDANADIQISVQGVQNGQFEHVLKQGLAITSFNQSNIIQRDIQFVPDNSSATPVFSIQLSFENYVSGDYLPDIMIDMTPKLTAITAFVILTPAQRIRVSGAYLQLQDGDNLDTELYYRILNAQHVQFEYVSNPGVAISLFTQAEINNVLVDFVHDGTTVAASYTFTYSDGLYVSDVVNGLISLNLMDAPRLLNNELSINEGQRVLLTLSNISGTDSDSLDEGLIFSIHDLTHGHFEHSNNFGVAITTFTQQDIIDAEIEFVHDGGEDAPAYSVAVSDGNSQTSPQSANINFSANMNDAPILRIEEWVIEQSDSLVLTQELLSATDSDNDPIDLVYQIRDIQHGGFYRDGSDTPLLLFNQQDVNDGLIRFRHDGSLNVPIVSISVNDGQETLPAQRVPIRFIPAAEERVIREPGATENGNDLTLLLGVTGGFVCLSALLGAGYYSYHNRRATRSRQGEEYQIPREVYAYLKVKGAANFKSLTGSQFVEQINGLVEMYDKSKGGIPEDGTAFSTGLADAIVKTCNVKRDRFKRSELVITGNEDDPLRQHAEIIVDQTERYMTHGTGSIPTIPTTTAHQSMYAATEMGVFAKKSPRKSQRSPRSHRYEDDNTHKRRSRSASQGGSRSLSQSGLHGVTRSRSNSRKSQRMSMVLK